MSVWMFTGIIMASSRRLGARLRNTNTKCGSRRRRPRRQGQRCLGMSNLLSLPRELRDEIFSCVLAPHGIITLIPHMETAIRRGCPPVTILASQAVHNKAVAIPREKIELQLLRTCRQIYEEGRQVLFQQNIWFFRDACEAERVMTEMGQKESRRIERTMVDFSKGLGTIAAEVMASNAVGMPVTGPMNLRTAEKLKSLGKVVKKTLSRSRRGNLRELIIRIDGMAIVSIGSISKGIYEDFLRMGRKIESWGKLQRSVEVEMSDNQLRIFGRMRKHDGLDGHGLDFILMKIHFSWGGKLSLNGQLIWSGFNRVSEVPVSKKRLRDVAALAGRNGLGEDS